MDALRPHQVLTGGLGRMADARRYGGKILACGQRYRTTPAGGQIIPACALVPLRGGDAERFGMGPAVMLGQDLADVAWPVGEGTIADLAAGDRQLGDCHRE